MSKIRQLMNLEQWQDAFEGSSRRPLLVFKHSTSCPISAGAHEELQKYMADVAEPGVDFVIVHVIEERPVSNAIAEDLGVQHQSPQAILVQNKQPLWHDSHWRITYDFLSDKLGNPENAQA